ncbi:TPA: flagellar motor switch protein FliN [bacterium]|jgi:flagellar motor switch protein FliN/FliY|nr:flagellar motor switch protein FliN [bacterium]
MKILKSIEDIWLSAMKASVTTLSALVGKEVIISEMERRSINKVGMEVVGSPYLVISSELEDLTRIFLLFDEKTVLAIATLMMGEETPIEEFNELSMSAAKEAFSQMLGAMALSISEVIGKRVQVKSPEIHQLDDNVREEIFIDDFIGFKYNLSITDFSTARIYQVVERESEERLMAKVSAEKDINDKVERKEENSSLISGDTASAKPVTFQPLTVSQTKEDGGRIGNLDLLRDVPIQISVELGRTRMLIKDLLSLSSGSIIELEKLAGEPVDILANGRLIAKGEVIVIDENFGVRITEILNPDKKMEEE